MFGPVVVTAADGNEYRGTKPSSVPLPLQAAHVYTPKGRFSAAVGNKPLALAFVSARVQQCSSGEASHHYRLVAIATDGEAFEQHITPGGKLLHSGPPDEQTLAMVRGTTKNLIEIRGNAD